MIGVFADYRDRLYSLDCFLEHIEDVSSQKGKVEILVVLKSSFYVALYNNIEATLYSVLEYAHSVYSGLFFDELPDNFKVLMVRYKRGRQDRYKGVEDSVVIDEIRSEGLVFPELSEYQKKVVVFSGNLDLRKINEICSSYGVGNIQVRRSYSEKILEVKNKRNKIAHGELSMLDAGKGIKINDLRFCYEAVDSVLNNVMACFNQLSVPLNENSDSVSANIHRST